MKLVGIVLVVLGVLGLAYGGITWTTKEKVIDAGPVQITRDKTQSMPLPPLAGGACLIVGAVLLIAGGRKA